MFLIAGFTPFFAPTATATATAIRVEGSGRKYRHHCSGSRTDHCCSVPWNNFHRIERERRGGGGPTKVSPPLKDKDEANANWPRAITKFANFAESENGSLVWPTFPMWYIQFRVLFHLRSFRFLLPLWVVPCSQFRVPDNVCVLRNGLRRSPTDPQYVYHCSSLLLQRCVYCSAYVTLP